MSFECQGCQKKVSNSEMLGLAVGHCGKAVLEKKLGISAFSKGEFNAGVLNGLKVPCPNCDKSNWKYD